MLFRDFKVWQVFGANTDVGKSVFSTLICKAWQRRVEKPSHVWYLKPVSTGPTEDHDHRRILKYVPGIFAKGVVEYSLPKSPHIAARENVSADKFPVFPTLTLLSHRWTPRSSTAKCDKHCTMHMSMAPDTAS